MSDSHTTGREPIPESRLQLNTRLLPALVGLLLVLQLAFPYRGWTILLVGLGGAWLISYWWARSLARNLRLTREMRFGWAQVGDRLEERFTLHNDEWAPALWVEVVDFSTMPDYQASSVRYAAGWGSTQWHTDGICTRRGLFALGPTSLQTGDPLGLYTVSLYYPDSMALMVAPPVIPLPAIEVAAGGRAGEGRRPRADTLEHAVSVAGVREYRPGDSLHWIHWRVSAHRDDLFVQIFDNTPASDWWVLLDLDKEVQIGEGTDSTEEHGVVLAASLASRGLKSGRAVGLATHGEELVWLPPQGGDGQRLAILQALAIVTPGTESLTSLLREGWDRPARGQRASLVIITPAAEGDWIEALLPLLQRGMIPLGVFVSILLGSIGWWMADSWRLWRLPPSEVVSTLYQRLYRHGRRLMVPAKRGDTPHEFAAGLTGRLAELAQERRSGADATLIPQHIDRLTDLFVRGLYSLHKPDAVEKAKAIRTWRRLRHNLWWAWLWQKRGGE